MKLSTKLVCLLSVGLLILGPHSSQAQRSESLLDLYKEGQALYEKGDYRGAIKKLEQFLPALKSRYDTNRLDVQSSIGHTNHIIGNSYKGLRNYQKAINNYIDALMIYRTISDKDGEDFVLDDIYSICNICGTSQKSNALAYYTNLMKFHNVAADKKDLMIDLLNISVLYGELGEMTKATEHLREVDELNKELKIASPQAILLNETELLLYYKKAMKIHKDTADKNGELNDLVKIGLMYWRLRDYQNGVKFFRMIH